MMRNIFSCCYRQRSPSCMIDDKTGEEIRSYSYQNWLEKTNGQ